MDRNNTFAERVYAIVRAIPAGQTKTYGAVAKEAGNPKAARAVGALMHANRDPKIPCHRVVAANGLGGYNRGVHRKQRLLTREKAI